MVNKPTLTSLFSCDLVWTLRKVFFLCQHREAYISRDGLNVHLTCPDCLGRTGGMVVEQRVKV